MVHDPHACFCSTLDLAPKSAASLVQGKGRAALFKPSHWGSKRILKVGFIGGSEAVRKRVAKHAQQWAATGAGLQFYFWTDAKTGAEADAADIRVSFNRDGRSWSYLGTDATLPEFAGQPTMNLGWLTETLPEEQAQSVILHEFGHALGLIHEHQNPHKKIDWDEDAVIADLSGPPNNWDRKRILSNMFKAYDPKLLFATKVDAQSIMMYPIKASWTKNGFSVGFNVTLSSDDKRLIKEAYPSIGGV